MNLTLKLVPRCAALLLAAAVGSASAQKSTPVAAAPDAHGVLRLATGAKGKGFSRVFADMQAVCGTQVALLEVNTEGGLQNLSVLSENRADLGFVQTDTLRDMKATDDAIGRLQSVMPMNANLLHVVARRDGYPRRGVVPLVGPLNHSWFNQRIDRFSDLRGLAVAVVGSARKLGRTLDQAHDLRLRLVDVETDEIAIAKVKSGEVAAMLTTSGWPSGPVQRLGRADGLKLIGYDLAVQPPHRKVRKNYDNLDAWDVEFLAAENLLVSRPFSAGGPKARAVQALQDCVLRNLTALQEGAYEPAWRDVRRPADGDGWQLFQAQAATQAAAPAQAAVPVRLPR